MKSHIAKLPFATFLVLMALAVVNFALTRGHVVRAGVRSGEFGARVHSDAGSVILKVCWSAAFKTAPPEGNGSAYPALYVNRQPWQKYYAEANFHPVYDFYDSVGGWKKICPGVRWDQTHLGQYNELELGLRHTMVFVLAFGQLCLAFWMLNRATRESSSTSLPSE